MWPVAAAALPGAPSGRALANGSPQNRAAYLEENVALAEASRWSFFLRTTQESKMPKSRVHAEQGLMATLVGRR